jgi:Flp pilus assembly pilin Flp
LEHSGRGKEEQQQNYSTEEDMQNLTNKRGQGLVEYILVVVVMAVLAIGVVQQLATTTKGGFTKASDNLEQAFNG